MRQATDPRQQSVDVGKIDLDTLDGINRAIELAVSARDRAMFDKLKAMRSRLTGRGAYAADLQRIRGLLDEVRTDTAGVRRGRPVGSLARDLAAIRSVLAGRVEPRRAGTAGRIVRVDPLDPDDFEVIDTGEADDFE